MSLSIFPSPPAQQASDAASAVGSRMEAATQALLQARNHVIAALDQQLAELQDIHRSLAYSPIPFVVVEESPPAAPIAPIHSISGVLASTSAAPSFPPPQVDASYMAAADSGLAPSFPPLIPFEPQAVENRIDPVLERATLDELNAALANAFASVSGRR
jgi:hypothetical protein